MATGKGYLMYKTYKMQGNQLDNPWSRERALLAWKELLWGVEARILLERPLHEYGRLQTLSMQVSLHIHTLTAGVPQGGGCSRILVCFCSAPWHSQLVCCWGKAGVSRNQCWLQAQRGCRGTAQMFCAAAASN